ncbi:MAG TPA: fibrobacter succinogenes major paralogous domain-containing protein [Paludibacter sp.]
MKKIILILGMALCYLVSFSQETSTFTDSRDGKIYKSIKIGNQTWMAENLNFETASGSCCYNNDTANCTSYGRLYNYKTALICCPSGWHLPSEAEWKELEKYLGITNDAELNYDGLRGQSANAGGKLKSKDGWGTTNIGATNEVGFNAIPGGFKSYWGNFGYIGQGAGFWSQSNKFAHGSYAHALMSEHNGIILANNSEDDFYSVRCIMDK